jgi:signal transduction histidine kinase
VTKSLSLLIVDDSDDDALLVVRELLRLGFEPKFERVATRAEMERALIHPPQIVLCDYAMPAFSSLEALAMLRQRNLDIPLIIVSGTIGDVRAVEVMRAGARDYVSKDNLAKLGVTIERELQEAKNRGEKRALEEQLLLRERMASIGLVAAGVVHEINNPLLALLNGVEQIEAELSAAQEGADPRSNAARAHADLANVIAASERIAQIVADVRLFSRADAEPAASTNVRTVVESSLRLAMHEVASRCRVTTSYEPAAEVALSATRLGQVCLNLILNAAQAITKGAFEQNSIHVAVRSLPSCWTELEVADTGCGIPADMRAQIFQPFFTTRGRAAGTGLGLFITHRIVTDAGGQIDLTSVEGEGTTFRVRLPPADDALRARRAEDDDEPAGAAENLGVGAYASWNAERRRSLAANAAQIVAQRAVAIAATKLEAQSVVRRV